MKLEAGISSGVQSMGRRDVNAPLRIADAKAEATKAWADAAGAAITSVHEITSSNDKASGELELSKRLAADKISYGENKAWLENNPVIRADDKNVPDHIRELADKHAKKTDNKTGNVNTADIIMEATEVQFNTSREESYRLLKQYGASKELQTKYNSSMTQTWTDAAGSAVSTQSIQRLQTLKNKVANQISDAINNRDVASAKTAIIEGEQMGALMPEEAGNKMRAIEGTINGLKANDMVLGADDQYSLDRAEDFIDSNKMDPAQMPALRKLVNQRQEHMYKLSVRQQGVTYGEGMDLLVNRKLNNQWISDQLKTQKINGSQANVLRNALSSPAPLASDPSTLDALKRKIISLRYPQEGDDPVAITERARKLRTDVLGQFTGAGPRGEQLAKQLTADDFNELTKLVDEYENTALGKGGQRYASALRTVKALTGYSDSVSQMIDGPYPAGLAYAAFTSALQDHMDLEGSNANPEEFVQKNIARFTAETYAKPIVDQLATQFPQYAELLSNPYTQGQVFGKAAMDLKAGRITREEFNVIRKAIQYQRLERQNTKSNAPTSALQ